MPDIKLTREELRQVVVDKARSSETFKTELLKNPKQAIGKLGLKILPEVELRVVEESAKVIYMVLPRPDLKLGLGLKDDPGCDGVGGCGFCQCRSN